MGSPVAEYFVNGLRVTKEEFDRSFGHCEKEIRGRCRPLIDVNSKHEITHNGDRCRVVMRRNKISVGCSDISPEALKELVRLYDKNFPSKPDEVVIQD